MADKQEGCAVFQQLGNPPVAFFLEPEVTHRQHLVHHQNIRLYDRCYGKAQPGDHTGGIVFQGDIDKIVQFRKIYNFLKMQVHKLTVMAQNCAVYIDIFPACQFQVKPRSKLNQGSNGSLHLYRPLRRVQYPRQNL